MQANRKSTNSPAELAHEQEARAVAEADGRRFAFLADISQALSASLDQTETLSILARRLVPDLADSVLIDVFGEDGQIQRVEAVHGDPAMDGIMRRIREMPPQLGAAFGMGRVLRTGQAVLNAVVDTDEMRSASHDDEHLCLMLETRPRSSILVPMISRGRVLGALGLALCGDSQDRRYDSADLAVAEEVAGRAAMALENARLYHEAQEAIRHRDESVAALRDTNQTLRALVQSCPLAIMVLEPGDGAVQLWNPAAERIFGWKETEVLGQPLPAVPPDRQEEFRRSLQAVLCGAMPQGVETVRQRKGGEPVHVSLWSSTVQDGQAPRVLSLVADVTARKQIETALRKSDARLRDLVDTAAEGVWIVDADRRTTYVNRRTTELLERPIHEILGHRADSFFAAESRLEVEDAWESCRRGLRQNRELCFEVPDGRRLWASASISPVFDEHGNFGGFLAMLTDITERRRLDEELRCRVKELAAEDRRKDEFLAMLAHELRNPLGAISNAGHVLDQSPSADPRTRELVAVIGRQSRHLSRLVDDLLDVSRLTRGKIELRKQPVELRSIVEGAVETTRPMMERQGHHLTVSLPGPAVWLKADATRIQQVLANLLSNAAKFTDPGGRIDLAAEVRDGHAVLRVRDDGQGIEPELLPRIFDLFVQEDRSLARSHGGLGIGLTLVRSLVERHGGTVEARSDGPGKGSELLVRLPTIGDHPLESPPDSPAARPVSANDTDIANDTDSADIADGDEATGPASILLVEDNVDAAEALAELLRLWGHEVEVAHDGADAVRVAQERRPDVVLLDIGLPGMDGYQVAGALRALPDLHAALIVALTGYGQESDRQRSRQAGFDNHLVKPVDLEELRRLVAGAQRPSARRERGLLWAPASPASSIRQASCKNVMKNR